MNGNSDFAKMQEMPASAQMAGTIIITKFE
jgi:hypothetical protein